MVNSDDEVYAAYDEVPGLVKGICDGKCFTLNLCIARLCWMSESAVNKCDLPSRWATKGFLL
ncbi:hypothetical protein DPMN_181725 [Dreissena polymorpha]|uniref:Uncharacterized protein n=1 Tax=Dreissena polymorpha TaxID=45954 RepID=A0A9D4DEZ7_DREPO|nr:hypothetical protein DPMN_181725 [Dreissena polymorpha]